MFRREAGQVLATLIRVLGDFDLAEDALQEAVVAALGAWPAAGLPDRPGCLVADHRTDTDWAQIEVLYRHLARVAPSPVVELNWAVAVAMAQGPEYGLARIDAIVARGDLDTNHLLFAARADLLVRVGRREEARAAYRLAAEMASTGAERRFLHRRLDELGPSAG